MRKELIMSLSKQAPHSNYASELVMGNLYLDALITKILIDVNLPHTGERVKQSRYTVLTAMQNVLTGLKTEQIAIVIGKLYAGITQQPQYVKTIEDVVNETVKKVSPINHSKQYSHEFSDEYSEFELNSSMNSNATFGINQSVIMSSSKTTPIYVEKNQGFLNSVMKKSPQRVEKSLNHQGTPQKSSSQLIEKTPESAKKEVLFMLELSAIKPVTQSPNNNKSTQNISKQGPAQDSPKKYVQAAKKPVQEQTAKDPDPDWQPLRMIDEYLLKIPVFRTEINMVSQLMKLPPIRYYRFRYEERYYVRAEFKISCYWTYYKPLEFYGEGWSAIYRQACEQAAYQVLRVLFMQCPQLWKRFIELKRRKGLM